MSAATRQPISRPLQHPLRPLPLLRRAVLRVARLRRRPGFQLRVAQRVDLRHRRQAAEPNCRVVARLAPEPLVVVPPRHHRQQPLRPPQRPLADPRGRRLGLHLAGRLRTAGQDQLEPPRRRRARRRPGHVVRRQPRLVADPIHPAVGRAEHPRDRALGQVHLGRRQHPQPLLPRVIAEQPADPRRRNDADAPQPAVQRPPALLAQVPDDEDRAAGLGRQLNERHQRPPHRLVAGRRRVGPQERRQRVNDEQARPVFPNGLPEPVDVRRQ